MKRYFKILANAEPSRLPPTINTSGYEDGPFVTPDESYLIFFTYPSNHKMENGARQLLWVPASTAAPPKDLLAYRPMTSFFFFVTTVDKLKASLTLIFTGSVRRLLLR